MAKVEIFTSKVCPYCNWAKKLLDKKGATYTEVLIDTDAEARTRMLEATSRTSVPQIFINGGHVGGYEDLVELDQQGKLEPMLATNNES